MNGIGVDGRVVRDMSEGDVAFGSAEHPIGPWNE